MTEQRKTISWLWWTVAGLMLLVAYPLSLGPIVWLHGHDYLPESEMFYQATALYCEPCNWLLVAYPDSMPAKVLIWYLSLGDQPSVF